MSDTHSALAGTICRRIVSGGSCGCETPCGSGHRGSSLRGIRHSAIRELRPPVRHGDPPQRGICPSLHDVTTRIGPRDRLDPSVVVPHFLGDAQGHDAQIGPMSPWRGVGRHRTRHHPMAAAEKSS